MDLYAIRETSWCQLINVTSLGVETQTTTLLRLGHSGLTVCAISIRLTLSRCTLTRTAV
jgi:hypothetical protein